MHDNTPRPSADNTFTPYSGLYKVIQRAEPAFIRFNKDTGKPVFDMTASDLESLEQHADDSATTMACSIATIGHLLMSTDQTNLPDHVMAGVGELLVTLGEAQLALRNLAVVVQGEAVQ